MLKVKNTVLLSEAMNKKLNALLRMRLQSPGCGNQINPWNINFNDMHSTEASFRCYVGCSGCDWTQTIKEQGEMPKGATNKINFINKIITEEMK